MSEVTVALSAVLLLRWSGQVGKYFCVPSRVGGQDPPHGRVAIRMVTSAVLCCAPSELHPQRGALTGHSRVRCTRPRFMRRCVGSLLDVSITDHTWDVGGLPMHMGGLGIRKAVRGRAAAYRSSWADGLCMIRRRHGPVADLMIWKVSVDHPVQAWSPEETASWRWDSSPKVGRLRQMGNATSVWPRLPDSSRSLLRTQGGNMSGLPFTCCHTSFHSRFEAQVFRVWLLRLLSFSLPPTSRSCWCDRPHDVLGHLHEKAPWAEEGTQSAKVWVLLFPPPLLTPSPLPPSLPPIPTWDCQHTFSFPGPPASPPVA